MADIAKNDQEAGPVEHGERYYRELIESSPLSILVTQDGKYLFANPAAARMLGYSDPADICRLPVRETIAPENHHLARVRLNNIKAGYSNPSMDITLLRADGSRLEVESTVRPPRSSSARTSPSGP